jgi:hypothetical protein
VRGYFKEKSNADFYGQKKIVSGRHVYEIVESREITNTYTQDYLILYSVKNFAMGAADEDGLTGCNDYRILILKNSKTAKLYFIKMKKEVESSSEIALLYNDEGVSDNISSIDIKPDRIVVSVNSEFQEGFGSYKLNILQNSDEFRGYKSDIKRAYQ